VRLKILLLIGTAAAGMGASYALADGGRGHHHALLAAAKGSCQRAHLLGTVAAPQTLTVTVTRSGHDSGFASGQVVTVSLGSSGGMVRVDVAGCGDGSTLAANEAELHAVMPPPAKGHHWRDYHGDGDHKTTTTTTTGASTTTTTGDSHTTTTGDSTTTGESGTTTDSTTNP